MCHDLFLIPHISVSKNNIFMHEGIPLLTFSEAGDTDRYKSASHDREIFSLSTPVCDERKLPIVTEMLLKLASKHN